MIALLLSLILLLFPKQIWAIHDPLSVANNKYGIHIADFNDIVDTASLINSNGGDWGYVTLVATDGDRDIGKWQRIFDEMRRLHIIPLVRLATHPEASGWKKPNPGTFDEIVKLFNSLNWPTQNRYIILFNEPNHAKEWGGTIDPEGYADVAVQLAQKLKNASDDFFVLPAGLDVSAASDNASLDAAEYIRRMIAAKPEFLTVIDGWTSHSYPNPAFSGSPYSAGRGTIRSFEWELNYLRNLGLSKSLPVFITETGWVHSQGKVPHYGLLSSETVGSNLQIAAASAWTDSRIVAITPFVFSYQDIPFDTFSWKKLGENGYYPQYDAYKAISKTKGTPKQIERYELSEPILPKTLVSDSSYTLKTTIKNIGQGILTTNDEYSMIFDDAFAGFTLITDTLPTLEPNQTGQLVVHLKTPHKTGTYHTSLSLLHNNVTIPIQSQDIQIIPPPSIRVTGQLGWRATSEASNAAVLVYDGDTLIHKYTGLIMTHGSVTASGLSNVVPGKKYRVVLLVPSYLPRQSIVPLGANETVVAMKRFYPFDLDKDGKFTPHDIWTLLTNPPHNMLNLFVSP
jgi:hypothetical protein